MGSQPANKDSPQNVIQDTDARLEEVESPRFSLPASSMLRKKVKEYVDQLVSHSVRVARRQQADSVSAVHVEWASWYLMCGTRRRFFGYGGTVGGLLLGVSFTRTLNMISSGHYSGLEILILLICGIVGAFLVSRE